METRTVDNPKEAGRALATNIQGIYIATMTTLASNGKLRGRPMATQQVEFDGDLWF